MNQNLFHTRTKEPKNSIKVSYLSNKEKQSLAKGLVSLVKGGDPATETVRGTVSRISRSKSLTSRMFSY